MTQPQSLDEIEQTLFRETASRMTFVGVFWIVISALGGGMWVFALLAISSAAASGIGDHVGGPIARVALAMLDHGALLATGIYTMITGAKLKRLSSGEGDPVAGVMEVMSSLGKMFFFYAAAVFVDVLTDVVQVVAK
jgi:hypothetical protein